MGRNDEVAQQVRVFLFLFCVLFCFLFSNQSSNSSQVLHIKLLIAQTINSSMKCKHNIIIIYLLFY